MDENMTKNFIGKMKEIVIKDPKINDYRKSSTFEKAKEEKKYLAMNFISMILNGLPIISKIFV